MRYQGTAAHIACRLKGRTAHNDRFLSANPDELDQYLVPKQHLQNLLNRGVRVVESAPQDRVSARQSGGLDTTGSPDHQTSG